MLRSTPGVKQLNRERIRRQIQDHATCTKAEVSRWTSLSVSTCNTILNEMESEGEIIHVSQEDSYVGRPASRFQYNPDYLHVLVMYVLGGQDENTVAVAVANAIGEVLWSDQRHPASITYAVIEELMAEQLSADPLIRGIAFGFPGVSHDGVIERCDVESLVGVDIVGQVRERFGIVPEIRNDMDFVANGVYHSITHHGGNLAAIYFPENAYVGCGFVIDGKALRGYSKFAGELSYIAEGFGISRADQQQAMVDRTAFRDFAAKMVLVACGTIDPEVVMLMGNRVDDADLAAISEFCAGIVSRQHLPSLLADNNVSDYYVTGLVRVMLDLLLFQLSG